MTAPISDYHSVEYEFEDVRPTIGGVLLEDGFFGVALLENDPGYTFYIKRIWLGGTVPDRSGERLIFGGWPRKHASITLEKPKPEDTSHEASLFRLVEDAIMYDSDVHDFWRREIEDQE